MDLFSNPRIGVVVPPENPTAEPEFNHLLGPSVNIYSARFPVTPGIGLRNMLETYNDVVASVLGQFGTMRLDAAVVACSASHYLLGPHGDERFCAELSAGSGFPVRSSTQAVLAACRALDLRRLTLVSPYQPWLTATSRRFWERAGLEVEDVVPVPARAVPGRDEDYDPYAVRAEVILDGLRGHDLSSGTALLFTGTGMATLAALEEIAGADPRRILLTSNLAAAWWAHRHVGPSTAGARPHALLRRLLDRTG